MSIFIQVTGRKDKHGFNSRAKFAKSRIKGTYGGLCLMFLCNFIAIFSSPHLVYQRKVKSHQHFEKQLHAIIWLLMSFSKLMQKEWRNWERNKENKVDQSFFLSSPQIGLASFYQQAISFLCTDPKWACQVWDHFPAANLDLRLALVTWAVEGRRLQHSSVGEVIQRVLQVRLAQLNTIYVPFNLALIDHCQKDLE